MLRASPTDFSSPKDIQMIDSSFLAENSMYIENLMRIVSSMMSRGFFFATSHPQWSRCCGPKSMMPVSIWL